MDAKINVVEKELSPRQQIVGDVTVELLEAGVGPPAVLVLGGGFSTAASATSTAARLAPRARVVAPSYPVADKMGLLVDELVTLLDALGLDGVRVYGHSLGAAVAHVLVRRHPTRVERLVLSGFGLYTPRRARRIALLVELWARLPFSWLLATYRRRMAALVAQAPPADRPELTVQVESLLSGMEPAQAFSRLRVLTEMIEQAQTYAVFEPVTDCPVLFVAAQDDRGFTAVERESLLSTYPGARVYLFAEGGHWVARHQRTIVNPILDDFLLS